MKTSLWLLTIIFLGGGVGASLRYLFGALVNVWLENRFTFLAPPIIATLTVNVIGSFLIGLLVNLAPFKDDSILKYFFIIGLLGSFTTFSTFSQQTVELWQAGLTHKMLINIFGNQIFSVAACLLGIICYRALLLIRFPV